MKFNVCRVTNAMCVPLQTMIGPILVAVNGYTDACNALTLSAARAGSGAGGVSGRGELARLVQDAVRHQADSGYPQAIILSGVSGSGKTYASMVLLRRLFDVAGGGPETDAFKHLAAAFTVLRALGTAATPANSNSSRIVSDRRNLPAPSLSPHRAPRTDRLSPLRRGTSSRCR